MCLDIDGTTVDIAGAAYIGGDNTTHAASGNSFVLENGATATIGGILYVNGGGSNNMVSVRSGAKLKLNGDVSVGAIAYNFGHYGKCGRVEVVGEGSTLTNKNYTFFITNVTGDESQASELFVGDGGHAELYYPSFAGNGARLVISNGTVKAEAIWLNGANGRKAATNSVVRIMGPNAKFSALDTYDRLVNRHMICGAPIFEFVIPGGGWASAPIEIKEDLSISDDTRIRIDKNSAKAIANAEGVVVPLITTGSSARTITADLSKISADLPDCCSLVNANGVLSVKIKKPGLTLVVR